jgi:hypothetical protein
VIRILIVGVVCALMAGAGIAAAGFEPGSTSAGIETLTRNGTLYRTETVVKKTRGKVITLPGGTKVVHVPTVVIHAHGRRIVVPAHNLPIHRVSRLHGLVTATVAEPMVPVTVTVYVPSEPVTVTEPASTVTSVETITVTLPLDPTNPTKEQTP